MRFVALLFAVALPLGAAAQPAPVPAEPGSAPTWSFGAGVAAGGVVVVSSTRSSMPDSIPVAVSASLERHVSPANWLVFGVAASYADSSRDVPLGLTALSGQRTQRAAIDVGLRLGLIRFFGHRTKGGYGVPHGPGVEAATPPQGVHG